MQRRVFNKLPIGAKPFTLAPKRFALNRPDSLICPESGRHPIPLWSAGPDIPLAQSNSLCALVGLGFQSDNMVPDARKFGAVQNIGRDQVDVADPQVILQETVDKCRNFHSDVIRWAEVTRAVWLIPMDSNDKVFRAQRRYFRKTIHSGPCVEQIRLYGAIPL